MDGIKGYLNRVVKDPLFVLVLFRIYLGYFYYQTGWNKVKRDFGFGWEDNMVSQIEAAIPETYSWYAAFLENVVLKVPLLFTLMVAWGELLLGFALFFGFSVRMAGLLGAFMAFNFTLMSGRDFWLPHFDTTLTLALLAVGMLRTGRILGADTILSKKYPNQKFLW